MLRLFYIFLILGISSHSKGEQFLTTVSGEVCKGNFTYYSMTYDGTILLQLTSTSGDCDLYVSQNTIKPTYEPQSHCLQSVTCGVDNVIVPKSFKRPVGIGVFGHPSHEVSQFHLVFYKIDDSEDVFYPIDESLHSQVHKKIEDSGTESNKNKEEQESFFWVLLQYVIEGLIEAFIL